MTANPVDIVYVDGTAVSKAGVRSYEKNRVRQRMADSNEVNNTSLSGQFAGIYVRDLQSDFDLDTSDTTTADDGVDTLVDFDGNRFKRVSIDTSQSQRKITIAGNVTVSADDSDIIVIAKTVGAATTVTLPPAADRTKSVRIVDGKYDAATNNITILPFQESPQVETIMGGTQYVIDSNGASITLTPLADGSGWI
jgi:hypothetical protein